MRENLQLFYGLRIRFTATVARFGTKPAYKGPPIKTLLLHNVCHNGEVVTDHLWMTSGKWSCLLEEGDMFSFDARVQKYIKGYRGRRDEFHDAPLEVDFRLVRPTNVEIINKNQECLL